ETSAYVLLTTIERNTVQTLLDQAKGHNRQFSSQTAPVEQLDTQEATRPGASESKFRQLCRIIVTTPVDQRLSQFRTLLTQTLPVKESYNATTRFAVRAVRRLAYLSLISVNLFARWSLLCFHKIRSWLRRFQHLKLKSRLLTGRVTTPAGI